MKLFRTILGTLLACVGVFGTLLAIGLIWGLTVEIPVCTFTIGTVLGRVYGIFEVGEKITRPSQNE